MARQTTITLIDDFDGSKVANDTVPFGLDGVEYEIDLTTKNAEKLRALLGPYIAAGRRAGRKPALGARATDPETPAIRAWARDHGVSVPARGRIPHDVREAFRQARTKSGRPSRSRKSVDAVAS